MRTALSDFNGIQTAISGDLASPELSLYQQYGYAFQVLWDGTLQGSIRIQATIDGHTWSEVTGTQQTISSPGSWIWNFNGAFYNKVRVKFSHTGGTGNMTFWAEAKGP